MNRYILKNVGYNIHIIDTLNHNRLIKSFDKTEREEAEDKMNEMNIQNDLNEINKGIINELEELYS